MTDVSLGGAQRGGFVIGVVAVAVAVAGGLDVDCWQCLLLYS